MGSDLLCSSCDVLMAVNGLNTKGTKLGLGYGNIVTGKKYKHTHTQQQQQKRKESKTRTIPVLHYNNIKP